MKKDDNKKELSAISADETTLEPVKNASPSIFHKAKTRIVTAVDQNNDGKITMDDLTATTKRWREERDLKKREAELKLLRPLFDEDLQSPGFNLPKMVRVIEMDKKHSESDLCIDSIGHESEYKGLRVVNIYPDNLKTFGLSFYPDVDNDVYYVDPCDRDRYIALDEYFNYLKVARVSELQKIAQDLGAKHFKVTYKEYARSSSKKQSMKSANMTLPNEATSANAEQFVNENSFSKVEIAAEMTCLGHEPVEPTLVYFKRDPQIQSLVALRMSDNAMTHQTYTLKMSNTSGIKSKDAASIDAAVTSMKANINVSIEKEAESENNRYFEYEIDF